MTTEKKGDGTVAVYAPKAFKFNTGDLNQGVQGIVDIKAGASRIPAAWAAHKWVKLHTGEAPGADSDSDAATLAGMEIDELQTRVGTITKERDEAQALVKSQGDELEAMRSAMAQSPDERVAAVDAKVAALQSENDSLRADLAKARSGKK